MFTLYYGKAPAFKTYNIINNVDVMKEAMASGWGVAMLPKYFIKGLKGIKIIPGTKKSPLFSEVLCLRHMDQKPAIRERKLFEFLVKGFK